MTDLLHILAAAAIRSGEERITLEALSPRNLQRLGWKHPTQRHRFPT